jgi:hypothetical protein
VRNLAAAAAGAAEIHVSLAAVDCCDLAGLRAIVGWDAAPGLVIDQGTAAPRHGEPT